MELLEVEVAGAAEGMLLLPPPPPARMTSLAQLRVVRNFWLRPVNQSDQKGLVA